MILQRRRSLHLFDGIFEFNVQRQDVSGRKRSDNLQFLSTFGDQNRCLILILNLQLAYAMGKGVYVRVENVIFTSDSEDTRPCQLGTS